jgi:hypothetical protein
MSTERKNLPYRWAMTALFSLLALALLAGTAAAARIDGAPVGGRPLTAHLSGGAEVPGPGDPDGTGWAHITLNQGQGLVCFEMHVMNIDPATAAHIHVGGAHEAGPVVVGLAAPADGHVTGCVYADRELIKAIRQNPEGYYVNVHNPAYPAGAVRGQLTR